MQIGKVQTRGQITLPREVRQKAGIQPGDVVAFEVVAPGRLLLRSIPRLRLSEALERYRIDGPVDDALDRVQWQERAARDVSHA
jgi:AbrB family looped-hinge helix DNA binding protein